MGARRYLIVGGGMAADAAAHALREADPAGKIALLADEKHAPYARPPLSKALWKGDKLESIWRKTEETGAELLLGRKALALDRTARRVIDDAGQQHEYDALLLATGGTPRRLPYGGDEIIYFRDLDDYLKLRTQTETAQRFAVIGGGFIGAELAAALRMNGKQVTLLFPEAGLGARVFPAELSLNLVEQYRAKGVDVRTGATVTGVAREGAALVVTTKAGERLEVDSVLAGIGIKPNVELAQAAGLAVDDGILVDDQLRTSDALIFAAGDVARFPGPGLGRTLRAEHEDAALTMGKTAAQAMAGQPVRYTHLPSFYSDLFELGYEAVGLVDSRLETQARWKRPFEEGTVYYLESGVIRGVLLVNTWGQIDAARELVTSQRNIASLS